jgi:hypothetical protein
VFPVRYKQVSYVLFVRNSVFKGLTHYINIIYSEICVSTATADNKHNKENDFSDEEKQRHERPFKIVPQCEDKVRIICNGNTWHWGVLQGCLNRVCRGEGGKVDGPRFEPACNSITLWFCRRLRLEHANGWNITDIIFVLRFRTLLFVLLGNIRIIKNHSTAFSRAIFPLKLKW